MDTKKEELISEITEFVMNSSDTDNLIISVFIAGMRANGNVLFGISAEKNSDDLTIHNKKV